MLELMEWLAERGVTTLFKVDGDRMTEHRKAWMVIVSGGPLGEDSFSVRTWVRPMRASTRCSLTWRARICRLSSDQAP